jgi:ribosome biogenesis GTPase
LDRKQYRILTSKLSELGNIERRKLYQQAAVIRKQSNPLPGEKPESLHDIVFGLLTQEHGTEPLAAVSGDTGTVVWSGPKTCRVDEVECGLNGNRVAVGDVVTFDSDDLMITSVSTRRTLLSRPDPGNPNIELPIAANVDLVIIVASVKSPPLHARFVDRYLITIERSGAMAALCVNKLDLLTPPERAQEFEKLAPYADLKLPIIGCSIETGEGLDEVKRLIRGRTCVFVGHSGVGKSSLLNKVASGIDERTGDVSKGYGRGRHTTTWSSLHDLGDGTRIIDTPGIRSLGLQPMSASELSWHFPEFSSLQCKFSNCTHTHEPECGVKEAIGVDVRPERYDTYRRILNE